MVVDTALCKHIDTLMMAAKEGNSLDTDPGMALAVVLDKALHKHIGTLPMVAKKDNNFHSLFHNLVDKDRI